MVQDFADVLFNFGKQCLIAGNRPGAGQRHVLPGPCFIQLVFAEGVDVRGDRPLVAGWAQTKIDLV